MLSCHLADDKVCLTPAPGPSLTRTRSYPNTLSHEHHPKRLTFSVHRRYVVTCLIFSHGRIISASDDHSIHVYCPVTATIIRYLDGHDGGHTSTVRCLVIVKAGWIGFENEQGIIPREKWPKQPLIVVGGGDPGATVRMTPM